MWIDGVVRRGQARSRIVMAQVLVGLKASL